jgi:hypothetical protein
LFFCLFVRTINNNCVVSILTTSFFLLSFHVCRAAVCKNPNDYQKDKKITVGVLVQGSVSGLTCNQIAARFGFSDKKDCSTVRYYGTSTNLKVTVDQMAQFGCCGDGQEQEGACGPPDYAKTDAEREKEIKAAQCKFEGQYCGHANDAKGETSQFIKDFEGACHNCWFTVGTDCTEAMAMLTGDGCYANCGGGMTPEALETTLINFGCSKSDVSDAQATIEADRQQAGVTNTAVSLNTLAFAVVLVAAAVGASVC